MISAVTPAPSRIDPPVLPGASATTAGFAAQVDKPNPSTRIDLTLGITVLSFHDADGQVVASTPTQQQLNTYLMFGQSAAAAKPADKVEGGSGLPVLA